MNVAIASVWNDPTHGLTERDFELVPVRNGTLNRLDYEEHLQSALDQGLLILPVHALGVGTLFKTPDGQPPVAANQLSALLAIAGQPGDNPWLIAMYKKGAFKKRIEVVVPGFGIGAPDHVEIRDEPFADIGAIAMHFTRSGTPVCKLWFEYWKRNEGRAEAEAAAQHLLRGVEKCRGTNS